MVGYASNRSLEIGTLEHIIVIAASFDPFLSIYLSISIYIYISLSLSLSLSLSVCTTCLCEDVSMGLCVQASVCKRVSV